MKVHSTYGTFELHLGQLGWRVILSGGVASVVIVAFILRGDGLNSVFGIS